MQVASDAAKNNEIPETLSVWQVAWPAIVGWFVPGLGHILIGDKKRGAIVAAGICSLWLLGLLIGGVTVIDCFDNSDPSAGSRSINLPFLAQVGVAPSLGVTVWHHRKASAWHDSHLDDSPSPQSNAGFVPSFGRVNEQGVLLTSLAGMLNMMAILDLLLVGMPRSNEDSKKAASPEKPAGTPAKGGAA